MLGIDAAAYINTATMPAGWTTPVWSELDAISDLAEKCDWDHAEIIIRRSWVKQGAKTVVDVGVTFKVLREPSNTNYQKLITALRTKTPVDVMILDGDITAVNASGVRYMAQVIKGGGSQNTNEALWREMEFIPFPDGDATHVPAWAVVGPSGTVTFTNITTATGATTLAGGAGPDVLYGPDGGKVGLGPEVAPPRAAAWAGAVGESLAGAR